MSRKLKIFLGGEGVDELGTWLHELPYRDVDPGDGILEAFIRRFRGDGFQIDGACIWSKIPKFKRGRDLRAAEIRNVLGLCLEADEAECDVVVFTRDRDRDLERERDIEEGIERASERFSNLRLVGGIAIEEIEAWLLALLGENRSEKHGDPKQVLAERHGIDDRHRKAELVAQADVDHIPRDALSLHLFLKRARSGLAIMSERDDQNC